MSLLTFGKVFPKTFENMQLLFIRGNMKRLWMFGTLVLIIFSLNIACTNHAGAENISEPITKSGLNDLLVKPGDTIDQVRSFYHTSAQPETTNSNTPGSTFLHLKDKGILFLFDQTGKIYNVRLESPFEGSVKGVKIGDSLDMVLKSLGEPTRRKKLPRLSPITVFYYPSQELQLWFDSSWFITTIILFDRHADVNIKRTIDGETVLIAAKKNQTDNITHTAKNATDSTNLNLVRIFHQIVTFYLPKEWGTIPKGNRNQQSGHFMLELIPDRQDWSDWQDIFVIQGLSDVIKTQGMPIEKLIKLEEQTAKDTQTYYKEVYHGDINGYQGVIILKTVNSNTAKILNRPYTKGEVALALYLAGENDLYMATRSWKADISPGDKSIPIKEAEINTWIDLFRQVKLTPTEK